MNQYWSYELLDSTRCANEGIFVYNYIQKGGLLYPPFTYTI
jgi:hypothetical protein